MAHVYAGAWNTKDGGLGGLYRRETEGGAWQRMLPDLDVQAVTVDPSDPAIVYAGTSDGPYRSTDHGRRWERLGFPDTGMAIWSIAVHPTQPRTLFAGAAPVAVYRSDDGGDNWRRMADPALPESWQDMEIGRFSPVTYGRDIRVSPHDPRVLYAALSVAASSSFGSLYRSEDVGRSWKRIDEGTDPQATLMAVALDGRDPARICTAARNGQVFGTSDGGATWTEMRLPETVRQVYALACG